MVLKKHKQNNPLNTSSKNKDILLNIEKENRKKNIVQLKKEENKDIIQFDSIIDRWQWKWSNSLIGKVDIILTILILIFTLQYYGWYLEYNENRTDIKYFAQLSDPILDNKIHAKDYSIELFILLYSSIIMAFCHALNKPDLFLEICFTKTLVIWIRMYCLYLVPLAPPKDTIPLIDPLIHIGNKPVLVRDLFFSGHTATTFVFFISCRTRFWRWKIGFGFLTILTGLHVLLHKTHYSIDVIAAPFFVYSCHRIAFNFRELFGIRYGNLKLIYPTKKKFNFRKDF